MIFTEELQEVYQRCHDDQFWLFHHRFPGNDVDGRGFRCFHGKHAFTSTMGSSCTLSSSSSQGNLLLQRRKEKKCMQSVFSRDLLQLILFIHKIINIITDVKHNKFCTVYRDIIFIKINIYNINKFLLVKILEIHSIVLQSLSILATV